MRWPCGCRASCSAQLLLANFDGSWQDVAGQRVSKKACGGRNIPVTVQSSTRASLAFTVWGDTIGPRCPTLSVLVRPVDARTLEGHVEVGVREVESPEMHASHSSGPAASAGTDSHAATPAAPTSAASIRLTRR